MQYPMSLRFPVAVFALSAMSAVAATDPVLERQFTQTVQPYVAKYCTGCHSGKAPAGALDLKSYPSVDSVVRDYPRWFSVHNKLAANQMPPKGMPQPPAEDSRKVIGWIEAVKADQTRKHAG